MWDNYLLLLFSFFFYRNKHTYTHKGEGKRLRVLTLYCNVRTISTIYLLSVRQIFLKKNLIFHLLAVVFFIYLSYMSKFKLSIFTHKIEFQTSIISRIRIEELWTLVKKMGDTDISFLFDCSGSVQKKNKFRFLHQLEFQFSHLILMSTPNCQLDA